MSWAHYFSYNTSNKQKPQPEEEGWGFLLCGLPSTAVYVTTIPAKDW